MRRRRAAARVRAARAAPTLGAALAFFAAAAELSAGAARFLAEDVPAGAPACPSSLPIIAATLPTCDGVSRLISPSTMPALPPVKTQSRRREFCRKSQKGMAADYATLEKIGEGTFGQVFRAKHRRTGEVFALKKIRLRRAEDGLATAALRELKALQQVEHRNVVRLVESFPHGSALVLVLEHMQSDLARLLEHVPTRLCEADVKCLALMLLHGVAACHAHNIVHRVRARAPAARPAPPRARASRDPRHPPNVRVSNARQTGPGTMPAGKRCPCRLHRLARFALGREKPCGPENGGCPPALGVCPVTLRTRLALRAHSRLHASRQARALLPPPHPPKPPKSPCSAERARS